MEIERKYLVHNYPYDLSSLKSIKMIQGYLSTNPVIRIRKANEDYILTMKSGGMMIREEYEIPLTYEQFTNLIKKVDPHLIYKTRYLIPYDHGATIELDIFDNQLAGLVIAEVEFDSKEAADAFLSPAWFIEEVTFDHRYHNSYLSTLESLEHIKI